MSTGTYDMQRTMPAAGAARRGDRVRLTTTGWSVVSGIATKPCGTHVSIPAFGAPLTNRKRPEEAPL